MDDQEDRDGIGSHDGGNPQDSEREDDQGDSLDEDDNSVEIDRYWPPPTTESVELIGSQAHKTLSAFTFNNSGTRFTTGSYDHHIQIWDFEALDVQRPESICSNQPCGQTVIKQLDYSLDDELILVIPTSCQAAIMAADGLVDQKNGHCIKGDQYLSDMTHTKGHVNMLNDGCWNPKEKQTFITCSQDSTVRIWDLNKLTQQKTVIKTRSPISGLKALPNVCKFSRDSLSIICGCNDGTIMLWDTRRKFITTSACIKNAHSKGSEITGIDFSYGPNKLCTRSEDGSLKIWDTRQLGRQPKPLVARQDFHVDHPADCCFSPDDKLILAGTSCTKNEAGQLLFLDAEDLTTKSSIDSPANVSVIRSRWHPKINHIGYSCSNGMLNLTYDKRKSLGGFLLDQLAQKRGIKRRKKYISNQSYSIASQKITTPHSLPLFREDHSSSAAKRGSYKPELPTAATNEGGRIRPAGSTLSSYIAKNIAKPTDDGTMDIRERILRHAEEAEKDPIWVKKPATESGK